MAETAALYGVLAFLLVRHMPLVHAPGAGPGIGLANRVTLARATIVMPVAALVFQPGMLVLERTYWWIVGLSIVALALDFLDGRIARSTGTTSEFGARFDMEMDAFLLLALSVIVWQSGKVGPWVILIGALRYLFVGSAFVWRSLDGALPPSWRRKAVCVVQGFALLMCLLPIIPAALASVVAAAALVTLAYSFAVDVRWLASNPAPAQ